MNHEITRIDTKQDCSLLRVCSCYFAVKLFSSAELILAVEWERLRLTPARAHSALSFCSG